MSRNLQIGETYLGSDGRARIIENIHKEVIKWRSVKVYQGKNVPYERSEGSSMEKIFIDWLEGNSHRNSSYDGSRLPKKKLR